MHHVIVGLAMALTLALALARATVAERPDSTADACSGRWDGRSICIIRRSDSARGRRGYRSCCRYGHARHCRGHHGSIESEPIHNLDHDVDLRVVALDSPVVTLPRRVLTEA